MATYTYTGSMIEAWLARLGRRWATNVLVVGEPGAGQAMIAEALGDYARSRGMIVLSVDGASNPNPMSGATRLASRLGITLENANDPVALGARIRARLRAVAGSSYVIVVSDAQELTPHDLAIFEDLAVSPPRDALLIVLLAANRSADGSKWQALPSMQERFARERRTEVVELAPLTLEEATRVVEGHIGQGVTTPWCIRDVRDRTAGRLDDIVALVTSIQNLGHRERDEVLTGSRELDIVPLPARIRARIEQRLSLLPHDALDVARALAVWREWAPVSALERLASNADGYESALEWLESQDLVVVRSDQQGAFESCIADPLVAQALYEALPALSRRRLHAEAAAILERTGPRSSVDTIALCQHYLCGNVELDPSRIRRIGEAARMLIARSRYASSREILLKLIKRIESPDLDRDGALRSELSVLLAETLSRAGDWRTANAVLQHISAQTTDIAAAANAMLRRVRDCAARGQHLEAREILDALLMRAADLDTGPRIITLIDSARIFVSLGKIDEAIRDTELAFLFAEQHQDWRGAAKAHATRVSILLTVGSPSEALAHGRAAFQYARRCHDDTSARARAAIGVGNALCDSHSLRRGAKWLRHGVRLAERAEDFSAFSYGSLRLASALIELGDWDGAENVGERLSHLNATLHRPRELRRSIAVLDLVRALKGRSQLPRHPEHDLPAGDPMDVGERALTGELVAQYEFERSQGHEIALETISGAVELLFGRPGYERLLVADLLPRHIDAALRCGFIDEARHVFRLLSTSNANLRGELPIALAEESRARGLVALSDRRWDEATKSLEAAAEQYLGTGYVWRRAMALRHAGQAWVMAGDRDRALGCITESYELLTSIESPEAIELRPLFRSLGRRLPRRQNRSLTPREEEVVGLASQGFSDAEIALQMGISRRTVTTHMQNVFLKWGIHSRLELRKTRSRVS